MDKKNDVPTFDSPEDLDDFMSEDPLDLDEKADLINEAAEKPKKPASEPKLPKKPQISLDDKTQADFKIPEEDISADDMLDIAADVPVQIIAVLGKKNCTVKELAEMRMGEVIELGRPANEVVDLVAGGKLIAKGELVEIEGKLGVRIVKMIK